MLQTAQMRKTFQGTVKNVSSNYIVKGMARGLAFGAGLDFGVRTAQLLARGFNRFQEKRAYNNMSKLRRVFTRTP